MLNAAIVGLGWWGKELVTAAEGSACLRFTHGVTLDPHGIRDFAEDRKLVIGTSYEQALADPAIDAVVLATPHSQHRSQVEAAARAGKHVFCEKPFAMTHHDAQAAVIACRRAGVALGVGHNRRLWPSIKALRDLCRRGTLGTVMHAEGNYGHDWLATCPIGSWRTAPEETRAGGMTGMGIHLLDCFSYIIGPMEKVSALSTDRALSLPAGDTTAALIRFANGATATLATTLKTPFVWRLAVYGSSGWAESTSETRLTMCSSNLDVQTTELAPTNHIRENLESFALTALGKGEFHIEDEDIIHTVAALDSVFDSANAGGTWTSIGSHRPHRAEGQRAADGDNHPSGRALSSSAVHPTNR
jgi:predicted dehydrogenase